MDGLTIKLTQKNMMIFGTIMLSCSFYVLSLYSWGSIVVFLIAMALSITSSYGQGNNRIIISFKLEWIHYFVIAFGLFGICTSFWAVSPSNAITRGISVLELCILLILIIPAYLKVSDAEDILNAIKWSGYAIVIICFIYYGPSAVLASIFTGRRLDSTFLNTNTIGLITADAIIIEIYQIIKDHKFYLRGVLLIPCLVMLAASESRKALVTAVVGVLLTLLLLNRGRITGVKLFRFIAIVVAAIVAIYLIMTLQIFSGVAERMVNLFAQMRTSGDDWVDHSAWMRNNLVHLGLQLFNSHKIGGVGLDNTRFYVKQQYNYDYYLHNNYVEVLAGTGIIGFLLYYIPYIIIGIKLFRLRKTSDTTYAVITTLFLMQLMNDYGMVSYYSKETYLMLALLFVYIKQAMQTAEMTCEEAS